MIGERVALFAGLFVVPVLLLWLGHGMRDRSRTQKNIFWGGVIGHSLALAATLSAAMLPPIWWAGGPFWRDFAVHWSLLLGAVAGALLGAALHLRG